MEPVREGFNWAAYITPFAVLASGATLAAFLLTRWRRAGALSASSTGAADRDPKAPGAGSTATPAVPDATPEELARLEAAIRSDDR
jgi:hypothetical protein